ncbi:MAG: hypothetical protein KDD00_09925 [Ignavibacteriae bacterium]|nr:hypothetical protein [Ignavibacteriota bacterium]
MFKTFVIFLTIIFLQLFSAEGKSNVAQPGLWNAGGMGNFSLLYPEDSLAYKKIQMVDEKISVQLYKGYAVIKGVYQMFNDTEDTIKLKTGYPLNGFFDGETGNNKKVEIRFDSLFGLAVKINSQPAEIIAEPSDDNGGYSDNDNWYVWQNIFTPGDTTVITVYFIVNTNNTIIRQGYAKDRFNGFIYILESGSTWKQPIINGEIRIQTMDGITSEEIKGIKPDSVFKINSVETGNILQYKFENLSPVKADNIIITYSENSEEFNFENILNEKEKLYSSIDKFSELDIKSSGLVNKKFEDPFEVVSEDWGSKLMILGIIGIPVLIIITVVILIIIFLIWLFRRSKKKVQSTDE